MAFFEEYRVSSPYGWRNSPLGKGREFHTGIDLVKEHNGPIYAFTEGEVIFASFGQTGSGFGGYGNVVAIKDKNGSLHCYCHLESTLVKVGRKVEKGQIIGRQGSTGKSTGSHLHYEIRRNSSPHFGWIANREANCYEPEEYLNDFYKAEKAEKKSDIEGHWAEESLEKAIKKGILKGYSEGTYRPDEPLTLARFMVFMDRLGELE